MAAGDLTSLANVKAELGLDAGFTDDDAYLSRQITAQSVFLVSILNRSILSATYVETLDGNSSRIRSRDGVSAFGGLYQAGFSGSGGGFGYALTLENSPVISITSIYIDGGDSTGATTPVPLATNIGLATQTDGYALMGDRIEMVGTTYMFTPGVANVVITYVAGYATQPADIDSCVVDLVAWQYRRRAHIGQRSKGMGGETISFDNGWPASFDQVVMQYRRIQV